MKFLMFAIIFLLNLNFTILRGVRNTLAVADLGKSAAKIPMYEFFAVLPVAIFVTWALTKLMRRFSLSKVFLVSLSFFLLFFLCFATFFYPLWKSLAPNVLSLSYYLMAELWKPILINILFWGLLNQNVPLGDAKKLYALLFLGASLGAFASGPLLVFCNTITKQWGTAFSLIMALFTFFGILIGVFYVFLSKNLGQQRDEPEKMTLSQSVKLCMTSRPLFLLFLIVLADYIAYTLSEVIFLDLLKQKYPHPCDYCSYMGTLSSWSSLMTIFLAFSLTPLFLRKYSWMTNAMILPLFLIGIEGMFFILLRSEKLIVNWLEIVVWVGSLNYTLCRALKYTFFDASKELAFVHLPGEQKMQGKLVIDGIAARVGRGGSSGLSLGLISIFGGVMASSFVTGLVALSIAGVWVIATQKLGNHFSRKQEGHV